MIFKKRTVISLTKDFNDPILISFNEPSAFEVQEANIVASTPNFIELSYEEFKRRIYNDHVSKSELRKWCEDYLESTKRSTALHEICTGNFVRDLLEKFCKGGE